MKTIFTLITLLSLVGCATTRLGTYDDKWYVVGENPPIEVQAQRVVADKDTWIIRVINDDEEEKLVQLDWRTMDYQNFTVRGWIHLSGHEMKNVGYFEQYEWDIDGSSFLLPDAVIKMNGIFVRDPTDEKIQD